MKQLLQIVGFALALAWVPITSHCSWESLIGGGLFECAPAAERGDCSTDGDGCGTVESGSYKVPETRAEVPAPVFAVVFLPLPMLTVSGCQQIAPPTAAPPEISAGWRFVSRTALPPRAPSLVS